MGLTRKFQPFMYLSFCGSDRSVPTHGNDGAVRVSRGSLMIPMVSIKNGPIYSTSSGFREKWETYIYEKNS
jgi:hypothetical protein